MQNPTINLYRRLACETGIRSDVAARVRITFSAGETTATFEVPANPVDGQLVIPATETGKIPAGHHAYLAFTGQTAVAAGSLAAR
jgi:hypothetical protein